MIAPGERSCRRDNIRIDAFMPSDTLRFKVLDVEPPSSPGAGDLRLRLEVETCGFTGAVDAWVEGALMEEFLRALSNIYDRLEGVARVESMSPGAFSLDVHREGPRGRVRVDGTIATWSGEPGWRRHKRNLALMFTELLDLEDVNSLQRGIRAQIQECKWTIGRGTFGTPLHRDQADATGDGPAPNAPETAVRPKVSEVRRLEMADYLASVRHFLAEASLRPEMYFGSLQELEDVLHGHWVAYSELIGLNRENAFNVAFAQWLWDTRRWSRSAGWAMGIEGASKLDYQGRRDLFFQLASEFLGTLAPLGERGPAPTDAVSS